MIEIREIRKFYDKGNFRRLGLNKVSFKINRGDFIFIVGEGSSGKTSLLNILGFLDKFNSGEYIFENKNVIELSEAEKCKIRNERFCIIMENSKLVSNLSVFENIELPLIYLGISKNIREKMVLDIILKLNLNMYKEVRVCEISNNIKQKVCIARALVNKGNIVIADNPINNLDSNEINEVFDIFLNLNKKGITIIVSCNRGFNSIKANKILYLSDGKIINS